MNHSASKIKLLKFEHCTEIPTGNDEMSYMKNYKIYSWAKMFIRVFLFTIIFLVKVSYAQDFFIHYPVSASINFNGTQQRLECTVYDSVLQTTFSYTTPWSTDQIIITGNNDGIVTYTFWTTPGVQAPKMEFLIYDYLLHQFAVKTINLTLSPNRRDNIVGGTMWVIHKIEDYSPVNQTYDYSTKMYRYNLLYGKWISFNLISELDVTSQIDIYYPYSGVSVEANFYSDYNNDFDYYYYDPVGDSLLYGFSGCPFYFDISDDYLALDGGCMADFSFTLYDAGLQTLVGYPGTGLVGAMVEGVFLAFDQMNQNGGNCFTYDEEMHMWMSDTIDGLNVSNIVNSDRVVTYTSSPPGSPPTIFSEVYNPQSKAWVKDSVVAAGSVTGLSIINGTVSWNDGNGYHERGYNSSTGWGSYNTQPLLDFQLLDLTTTGFPVIHVRNYTIGRTDLIYDFGDGIKTTGKLVTWHAYKNPGTYNVCLYTSDSSYSVCKQISINSCNLGGIISASNDTICGGDTITMSATSFAGNIQWQRQSGANWVNETGFGANDSIYSIAPLQSTTYRIIFTLPGCSPVLSNYLDIKVYPNISDLELKDTLLNICHGTPATLKVLNNPGANYLWQQSNNGVNWINAPGLNTNDQIAVTPNYSTHYRVNISSGVCLAETLYANVNVIAVPVQPTTSGDTICGPGLATLSAAGPGTIDWYQSLANELLGTGNTFSPTVSSTSNYLAVSSSGYTGNGGYLDSTIGVYAPSQVVKFGHRFFVDSPGRLHSIAIYPESTGVISVALRKAGTASILASKGINIVAGAGKTVYPLNFTLEGGVIYDLTLSGSSFTLGLNTSGITYPVVSLNDELHIMGYIDSSGFSSSLDYYGIYEWNLSAGCYSSPVTAQVVVGTPITSNITAAGPVSFCEGQSVTLNAQPTGIGYQYSWLNNNAVIQGANAASFTAMVSGSYKCIVRNSSCEDTSGFIRVTVPCSTLEQSEEKPHLTEGDLTGLIANFSSQTGEISIKLVNGTKENLHYLVFDNAGRVLLNGATLIEPGQNEIRLPFNSYASGIYLLKVYTGLRTMEARVVKY